MGSIKLNFKSVAIFLAGTLLSLILIDILLSDSITSENIRSVKGHFYKIEQQETRGEYSYNLFTAEQPYNYYKIGADDSDCFFYYTFLSQVKTGQAIEIGLCKNDFLRNESVVSLVHNKQNYISINCINDRIADTKILSSVIFFCLVLIFLFRFLYLKKLIRI
jgi:hypothetical protein